MRLDGRTTANRIKRVATDDLSRRIEKAHQRRQGGAAWPAQLWKRAALSPEQATAWREISRR
jgi:hypothetical protein